MSGSSSSSSNKPTAVQALPPLVPPLRFTTIALSPLAAAHPPTKASLKPTATAHTTASSEVVALPSSSAASSSASSPVSAAAGSSPAAIRHPQQRKAVAPSLAQAVYRGSHPKPRNLPFLTRLRLKTIVSLTPKPLPSVEPVVAEWAERNGVKLEWIKCEKPKDEAGGLTKEAAAKALTFMLDTRNLPLYVHCLDALNVTSLLTALLRKVQAWSSPSLLAELSMNLAVGSRGGPDEELFEYQRNFVAKWGSEGVKLAPRRFIPVWCWPAPYLLARLRDPYDVLPPPPLTVKEREKQAAERPSSSGEAASAVAQAAPSHHHRRTSSVDGAQAPLAHVPPPAPSPPPPPSYGVGALPVLHPTLKLRFESDPDLPPPPKAPSPPPTPLSTSRHIAREGSQAGSSRIPVSPVASRPTSRSGRAPLASGTNNEPRVLSRPPSPRRRTLTAADPLGIEAERERERATAPSPYLQHALHRTSSRPLAPSQLSHSSTPTSPPHSPPASAMRSALPSRLQQQYDNLSIDDGDVETPKRGVSSSAAAHARVLPAAGVFGEENTPRARASAASPRPSIRSRNSSSYSAGSSPVDAKASAAAYAERGATSSPTPTARSRAAAGSSVGHALNAWAASSDDSVDLRSPGARTTEELEEVAYSTSPEDESGEALRASRRASSRGSFVDAEDDSVEDDEREIVDLDAEEEEELDEEDEDSEEEDEDEEEEDEDEDGSDAASDRALEALDLA